MQDDADLVAARLHEIEALPGHRAGRPSPVRVAKDSPEVDVFESYKGECEKSTAKYEP